MKYCFLLLFLLSFKQTSAQDRKAFDGFLKQFNVEYKRPKGYLELDTAISITNGRTGNTLGVSKFSLISNDRSLLICFSFSGPIDTAKRNVFKMQNGEMWDPNKNYIPFNWPYQLLPAELTRSKYNADVAGTYRLTPSKLLPILDSTEKCRVLFVHKQDLVDLEIYYYYKGLSEKQLERRLRKADRILRFKKSN